MAEPIPTSIPRSTLLLSRQQTLESMRRTNNGLLDAQQAISTGVAVRQPSDDATRSSTILWLQEKLRTRRQLELNMNHAVGIMNMADQSLNDVTSNLLEANSIASSQVGIGSSAATRSGDAAIIAALIQSATDIANRTHQGTWLFGGDGGGRLDQPLFTSLAGGISYSGGQDHRTTDLGLSAPVPVNSNGVEAFGAVSVRMASDVDLDPQATSTTPIDDVRGAQGTGIARGSLLVTVNSTQVSVDLSTADTLQDVVVRISDAINNIDPAAGGLVLAPRGFQLTANGGHTITIDDVTGGRTAADLGIELTAAGTTVTGNDIDPLLTERTELGALGVVIDWTGGLKISQGATTKVADFATATTIQDLSNEIQRLDLGLRLEIDTQQQSLMLVSQVSGVDLAVTENAGGTTAQDLGLRTFGSSTQLDAFRFGLGVDIQSGQDDFAIQLHDGRTLAVNLDGAHTVDHVLEAIRSAAAAQLPPLVVGDPGDPRSNLNVGLAADGNGFLFQDNTDGASDFRVRQLGQSLAATHLGIYVNAGSASTIEGTDQAKVRTESVWTHLINLRDALRNDDTSGIRIAGSQIEQDLDMLAEARARIGVRTQRVEQEQHRSGESKLTEQAMLSSIRDTDFTEAISRFMQLQQQLEATLRITAQGYGLSLLDFLR